MPSLASPRSFFFVGLLAVLALPLVRENTAPRAVTTPVVQKFDYTLTTYRPSSATGGQDLTPVIGHRGTRIDGSLKV